MDYLPFPLGDRKQHKMRTKSAWKNCGLKFENNLAFDIIYKRYIFSAVCELCDKKYEKRIDRQMEHNHEKNQFRNICCRSCNLRKRDVKKTQNNSGNKNIYRRKDSVCRQGFRYIFHVYINGKPKTIKTSTDLMYLFAFSVKWKDDNNYYM